MLQLLRYDTIIFFMGAYNRIQSDIHCPNCHCTLEWLSKYLVYDGFLLENVLDTMTLRDKMYGHMYTSCKQCNIWIEAEIENGKERITAVNPKGIEPA